MRDRMAHPQRRRMRFSTAPSGNGGSSNIPAIKLASCGALLQQHLCHDRRKLPHSRQQVRHAPALLLLALYRHVLSASTAQLHHRTLQTQRPRAERKAIVAPSSIIAWL